MKKIAYSLHFLTVSLRISIVLNFFDRIEAVDVTNCYYESQNSTAVSCAVPKEGEFYFVPDHIFSNVTKITLNNPHLTNPALITEMKPFERFFQLENIYIDGPVKFAKKLIDSEEHQENLRKHLFRIPTLTHIHLTFCNFMQLPLSKDKTFILPSKISTFKLLNCSDKYFNWTRITSLKELHIGNVDLTELPELGFPSVEGLSIQGSTGRPPSINALAVFCNLTYYFYPYKMYQGSENYCECTRLVNWETYLSAEGINLYLKPDQGDKAACDGANFGTTDCSNYTLEEAKVIRKRCLSLKPPVFKDESKTDSKTAAPPPPFSIKNIPFWVYIILGFFLIALIFTIIMFMAEKEIAASDDEYYEEEDDDE